jgi:enoyl-CoA hydratase
VPRTRGSSTPKGWRPSQSGSAISGDFRSQNPVVCGPMPAQRHDPPVLYETDDAVAIVTINRPEVRNAVDGRTATALREAFESFDDDAQLNAAVLTGAAGAFCAGFDLKAVAEGHFPDVDENAPGPMGPTRWTSTKPVVAAIEGYAVGGGLELAVWCDLRVAARTAVLGVFSRRVGVPLIDGGTVRLPRLIGQGRALDLILTGRPLDADEALAMGLVDRVVDEGRALAAALETANTIAGHPQAALRSDRRSSLESWGLGTEDALANEARHGERALTSGEALEGAKNFRSPGGRV